MVEAKYTIGVKAGWFRSIDGLPDIDGVAMLIHARRSESTGVMAVFKRFLV